MTHAPYLQLSQIGKTFTRGAATTEVLKEVSLDIAKGEYISIIGMLAAMSALMLFAVWQLEYPYQRAERVGPDVFTSVTEEPVGAVAANHDIAVSAAIKRVVAIQADQNVVVAVSVQIVDAGMSKQDK